MNENTVVVVGGGIAGLSFAVRYHQLGGRAEIYERGPHAHNGGIGFILLENGLKALERLVARAAVEHVGNKISDVELKDEHGKILLFQRMEHALGIKRKALLEILASFIPNDMIHIGKEFSHFDFDTNGLAKKAFFKHGEAVESVAFLGCDGIRSKVREKIFPDTSLEQVKVKEIVSIVHSPAIAGQLGCRFVKSHLNAGGLAVGCVPSGSDEVIWYLQFDATRYSFKDDTGAGRRMFAEHALARFPEPFPTLVRSTDFSTSYLWHNTYLNPVPSLYKNNVALVGDAGHAMLSFTSQGVSAAVEDAMLLAELLYDLPTAAWHLAFELYSIKRRNVVLSFLEQGIEIQENFLAPVPHTGTVKVPFAS